MTQYFQLTPDILLEYIYDGDPKLNDDGIKGNKKDLYDSVNKTTTTMLLKSEAFSSKYLCFKNENEGLDSFSNLVLPLNNTETQFVLAKSKYQNFFSRANTSNRFLTKNGSGYVYLNTNYDENIKNAGVSCDVRYDKCVVHFTSRNYFGSYDSLIFQAYAYMKDKSKLYFASFLFKRTSNLEMKSEQLLYNEKLYTTQIEFDIPSVYAIFSKDEEVYNQAFNDALKSQNIELLENTPIGINVYGVSSTTKGTDNYDRLKTLKINSISIPYTYNRFDEIHVNISEAKDGDYFYIDPELGSGYSSFVDYIETMGEDIRSYMIMHELCLKETWVNDGIDYSEITHKEFHIIDINEDDESEVISKKMDAKIKYRPICMKGGLNYRATIIDTIKIINTVDSSSYEVTGSLEISNPNKYGKKIKKLDFNNEMRPIVNVYNKNTSSSRTGSSSVAGSGSISGSKTIGTLSGQFSVDGYGGSGGSGDGTGGSGGNGDGTGGSGGSGDGVGGSGSGGGAGSSISGSYSGDISGLGNLIGNISGTVLNKGTISGNISGSITIDGSSSTGFVTGTFSSSEDGTITGTISGYIPGIGYISGTISGSYPNGGFGSISGTITSTNSDSNSNSSSNSNSGNNSNSNSGNNSNSNSGGPTIVVNKNGGGFAVANRTQNITSFIECTNIGVSISEISPDVAY